MGTLEPVRVGVIGCGTISGEYLRVMKDLRILDVVACADLYPERAARRAAQFGIPRSCTVEELLSDHAIELVVNLTVPAAHAAVGLAALEAGKSLYNEKPLAIELEDARRMLELARVSGLSIGCAPDTFLGGSLQTCRKLVDDGCIGQPVAAFAALTCHGPEDWHPDPAFYYRPGGGPMFDMGPYYLTALISLLGPVRRVTGSTRISFARRTIGRDPNRGDAIEVTTPTHIAGVLDFACGAVGTIITSFDVWSSTLPPMEIYGTRGSLSVPDPNLYGDPVRVRPAGEETWRKVPLTYGYTTESRGIGVADMAYALRNGGLHRANGELAFHVLEIMHAFELASGSGTHVELSSTCARPDPISEELLTNTLESRS